MKETLSSGEVYSAPTVVEQPPLAESFYDADYLAGLWPEIVTRDPNFLRQIQLRTEIRQTVTEIFDSLPNPAIRLREGIEQGHLSESQAAMFYEYLSTIIEDYDYRRLIFYLPFEVLPDASWEPQDAALGLAIERFKEAYIRGWTKLLTVHDVRANFVDGDVLEVNQRTVDLPRVVKAAHLIPELLEKGLLDIQDVIKIIESTNDPVLISSVLDIAAVLLDKDFITKNTVMYLESFRPAAGEGSTTVESLETPTAKRQAWLDYVQEQKVITGSGQDISRLLLAGSVSPESVIEALTAKNDSESLQTLVVAVQSAIESAQKTDYDTAHRLYQEFEKVLVSLASTENQQIKDMLFRAFRRLHRLGLIQAEQLETVGVQLPTLSGKLSENLKLIPDEIENIKQITAAIETNSELISMIYPAVLVYGSRLKGYGEQSADLDLAVFVRPGIRPEDKPKLRQLINEVFYGGGKPEIVTEFWLEENGDNLDVLNHLTYDPLQAEKHWAHVLFGASWIGSINAVKELQARVLQHYLRDDGEPIYGHNARSLYLEEIERDILQYRLLQKGYERHYPPANTRDPETTNRNRPDAQSMFWDSGFRQLATKLFIDKVFIPKA